MADAQTPRPVSLGHMELDVHGLRDLLGLAAMAVEADRVLSTLDSWEPACPPLQNYLRNIPNWRQWTEHRDSLGGALWHMQRMAERLLEAQE